jgi:RNA polymerase sigma-70 factor (ECF subfamily)
MTYADTFPKSNAEGPDGTGLTEITDEEIVEMYFARSSSALEETANKYGKFLFSVSYHILHNKLDAEECTSDAYMACWNTIPPTRPQSLRAYSGALCRNISLDKYKHTHAEKRGGGKTETLLSEIEEFLPAEGAGADYGENEAAEVINKFLATLNKKERVIFVRRYWFADDVKEIAARTGEKEGTVKSLLFRLRKRLKEKLEEEGITP